ncbi:MAG TPA: hypothetical protein P5016_16460 [Verrucomicrobiales bacterium]|nr:hypothetical protein [Verrucomicrobiales bacterium]
MLANIALPSFLPHSIATLIGIFAIAAIEGWFLMRGLRLGYAESYRHALNANWKSTIVGIPLAWLLWIAGLIPVSMGLTALGFKPHPAVVSTTMQTVFFSGMMPTEWMNVGSAAAWLVMLIPFWMGSVWIERRTLLKRLPDGEPSKISSAIVRGNLASYGLFLLLGAIQLSTAIADLPGQRERFKEIRERQERAKQQRGVLLPRRWTADCPIASKASLGYDPSPGFASAIPVADTTPWTWALE